MRAGQVPSCPLAQAREPRPSPCDALPSPPTHWVECGWSPSRMCPCMEFGSGSGPSSLPALEKRAVSRSQLWRGGRGRAGTRQEGAGRGRGQTSEQLSQGCLGFVHRHLSVLVTDADEGPVSHQVLRSKVAVVRAVPSDRKCRHSRGPARVSPAPLTGWAEGLEPLPRALTLLPTHPRAQGPSTHLCHLVLTPEAGVVQRHVPMLIHCVDVSFVLQELVPTARQTGAEGSVSLR